MSLFIDLTEFLVNPITTGIQRIIGEICRHAPPQTVTPVRLRDGSLVKLPPELIEAIAGLFRKGSANAAEEIRRLAQIERGPMRITERDTILVPEVFDNPVRVAFFLRMSDDDLARVRFIVYDLLPMTHPEYFIAANICDIYGYFRLLARATHCGFISEHTRDEYYSRFKRVPSTKHGFVLPLGADALGATVMPLKNRRLRFTVLGTIEPRKNHRLILDAFRPLLGRIPELTLTFLGKMGWSDPALATEILSLATKENSGFEFHAALS